jgi:DNA polymerase III delta prime subunit
MAIDEIYIMINDEEFAFEEKYRPQKIEDCILPQATKELFQSYVNNKNIPNLFLSGQQGSGKTTSAKAMCNEIGCDYLFINGSSENGIDVFRNKITNYASSVSLSGGKKVILIDEADRLSPNAFDALRAGTEAFHKNCTFILTGNYKNRIPAPILSRFIEVDFTIPKNEKKTLITQFFKRICSILTKEGIEFDKEVLAVLINKFFPDYRKSLVELQRYSVNGKIDSGILSQVGDIQLKDLIKNLKEKDYTKTRSWVVNNLDNDPNTIYRKIYDGLYDFLKPSSIPNIILIMARYQYQTSFVVDPEIQLLSFLTEVMLEGEFL